MRAMEIHAGRHTAAENPFVNSWRTQPLRNFCHPSLLFLTGLFCILLIVRRLQGVLRRKLKDPNMSAAWLTYPLDFTGMRMFECGEKTLEQCEWYQQRWHFWFVLPSPPQPRPSCNTIFTGTSPTMSLPCPRSPSLWLALASSSLDISSPRWPRVRGTASIR